MDRIEAAADRGELPRGAVDEAGMLLVDQGEADIGVNFREQVDWAFRGIAHQQRYQHTNLRALARLVQPQYVGIAATYESGITSLEQVAAERRPIRLFTVSKSKHQTRTMGFITSRVMELSGFTQADMIAWGGIVFSGEEGLPAILERNIDLMAIPAYSSWGPSWGSCWMEAQIRLNLRFLPVAEPVRDAMVAELNVRKGAIPRLLFRGVNREVPTFVAANHTVSTHADLRDEQAYAITRAIDEHPECLQQQHVVFAYDPHTAWQDTGVPLHPGAEAYYHERGYMKRSTDEPAVALAAASPGTGS
jgi:TRAP transporter TAXI family solute receptor